MSLVCFVRSMRNLLVIFSAYFWIPPTTNAFIYGLLGPCFPFTTPALPTDNEIPAHTITLAHHLDTVYILLTMDSCVNCGLATNRCNALGRHILDDAATLSVIQQWRSPEPVHSQDHLCQACWSLAQDVVLGRQPITTRQVGHSSVCLRCRRSLTRQKNTHILSTASDSETRVYNVIREWILPITISAASRICHSCWVLAKRAAVHMVSGPSTSSQHDPPAQLEIPPVPVTPTTIQEEPTEAALEEPIEALHGETSVPHEVEDVIYSPPEATILLPDFMRSVGTEKKCFIEGCQRSERYRVPLTTRKMLLNQFKYYIPLNNRLCDRHVVFEAWDFLDSLQNNYCRTFTANHIQDMLTLKESSDTIIINFDRIDDLEDHTVYTWLGFSKTKFSQILNEVPQFLELPKGNKILACYLMKMRTGECNDRLSTLFKVSKTQVQKWLNQARELMTEYFVPHNLGFNHINRTQVTQRNLTIPNALFGDYEGENRPIVILDGTYCYIEKSSNYLYQKKTYSLHKYRNLVKPFLMVCTDGYIIDVLGPYPATTSDSDILKNELNNINSPMRQYFENGDAFILDRGFRDALPLLGQCGFRTYVPASLREGEFQLSTLEANKSRAVTICRWVVEVVNGRFKRDFKLFRQTGFNTTAKSLMKDFEVAAALINRFHPPIVDRVDAGEIINQINMHMNINNDLADFIERYQYNRRRADFETMTVHSDNLNNFPQLTYSQLILICLGTYQLKQARSYFGEHVRGNDGFVIEVCREVRSNLLRELSNSNTTWLLRGRIQSRHISRKTYFIYILFDSSLTGRESILQYCCNCLVGRRTVGCCAHVMSIIWYLSWARYQENILPPAQFIEDVLIIIEND